MLTLAELQKGEKAIIADFVIDEVPLKLIEMGCLPGNSIELVQHAPFHDPLYININDTFLAIRKETASKIHVKKVSK